MEAWELVVVGVWAFVVSLIGGLVGLVLGNLRLPVVVQFSTSPAAGAGANVAISGAAAVASAWAHARGGRVSWRLFAWMAPPSPPAGAPEIGRAHLWNAAGVGFGVGLLGGFVGLILGSMRLPAMVKYVGMTPYAAVGTNAAVGVIVGIGGLVGHLPSGIDWDILWAGAAGGVPGALLGARLTGRLPEHRLMQAMTLVLVVSGLAMVAEGLL